MKHLAPALAAALLAFTLPASAQVYPRTAPQPMYYSGLWPEMMDDGSSSDFPTHTPSDFVADQLNRQMLDYNAGLRLTPP